MFRLLTHPRFRKITSGVYLLAVVLSAFGAFHAHRLAVDTPAPFHELHDASCDYHAKPPVHLSDHCAACQFLVAGGLAMESRIADEFSLNPIHPPEPLLSTVAFCLGQTVRGPPSLL